MNAKKESAMEIILSGKGTVYRSYLNGWQKSLDNYNKLIRGNKFGRKSLKLELSRI